MTLRNDPTRDKCKASKQRPRKNLTISISIDRGETRPDIHGHTFSRQVASVKLSAEIFVPHGDTNVDAYADADALDINIDMDINV